MPRLLLLDATTATLPPWAAASRPSTLRRRTIAVLALSALSPIAWAAGRPAVEVWKAPTCGCCGDWIRHLQSNGFDVITHEVGNVAIRARLGLPQALGSCHTATVNGYVIEGHVPASDIQRLLRERPAALGLTVPGMPVGSPGMDGPAYGGRRDPYDVLLVARDGSIKLYQRYR